MTSYTEDEKSLARKLFVEHNRRNGALYPDGFGFMSFADREKWYIQAREKLTGKSGGLNES